MYLDSTMKSKLLAILLPRWFLYERIEICYGII